MNPLKVAAIVLVCWTAFWGAIVVVDMVTSRATPNAGTVGVARSGASFWWPPSWLNGHGVRSTIQPNAGSSFIGLGSTTHYYPSSSSQRTYTITSDKNRGDRPGVDVEYVSTSDGVLTGLNGTIYFNTGFDGSTAGNKLLRDFDNRFGTRTFPDVQSGNQVHAWDGTVGWDAWLDSQVRPIIDNDLRQQIQGVSCAALVSSCALVYNSGNANAVKSAGGKNQATLAAIQNSVNTSLQADIASTLGADYFSHVKFLITGKPNLPDVVQSEINKAQAQFAAVGTANAKVQQAAAQTKANNELERGYKGCAACAERDILKAIPPGVHTFAPGAGFSITGQ